MTTQLGSSNRLIYDQCEYNREVVESTKPLYYRMYLGQFENESKCKKDKFWHKYDADIVDIESDLLNINRRASKCPEKKYSPTCNKSKECVSTFDPSIPIILDRDICPVVFNNIPKNISSGLKDLNKSTNM